MAGRIPESVIEEIRRRTDILDVVGAHVNLNRKSGKWWGLCPFHNEKTPSFTVNPDREMYYCFGCQKHGSIFDFVMEIEGLTFPEAVRRLADKAGIEVPESSDDSGEKRTNRKALEELHSRVCGTFHWLLKNSPDAAHARDYLQNRGITDETADIYQLGWAPASGEWLYDFLLSKKYSPEFLAESGLFSRNSPRWSYFVDRLMFPVMPDDERVVAFSGRALSDHGPKYINSPETVLYRKSQQLYGYGPARKGIRKAKQAVLCEGNVDVLACMQAGVDNVVAPLGTAFTEDQARLLKRQAEGIVLLFDGDAAGRAATKKSAIIAEGVGLKVSVSPVPAGRDPAEILESEGADSLKKVLQGPINVFEYLLDFVISARTGMSGEAQEEALVELTPYLDAVESEVRKEAYLKKLAETINADPGTVMREFRKAGSKNRKMRRNPERDVPSSTDSEPEGDEAFLITAVTVRTELFATLRKMLAPEAFQDRRALAVYRVLDELSVGGRVPRTEDILEKIDDEGMKRLVLRSAASGVYDEKAEEAVLDMVNRLIVRGLEQEKAELVRVIARDSETDPEMTEARLRRQQDIDGEIMRIRQGKNGRNQV